MSGSTVTACAVRELEPARDLVASARALRAGGLVWLLDSALASGRLGRFSFAGSDPAAVLRAREGRVELSVRNAGFGGYGRGRHAISGDALLALRALLPSPPVEMDPIAEALPFVGGAVGCLGSGLASEIPWIRTTPRREPGADDLTLHFVDRLVALDHATGRRLAVGLGSGPDARYARRRAEEAADAVAGRVRAAAPEAAASGDAGAPRPEPVPARGIGHAEHRRRVLAAKERIAAGDVYQVCLTHRLTADAPDDAFQIYTRLRRISPAPFAAYLELDGLALLSSSPERFLRLDAAGRCETRPIKGTRPRGATPEEDAKLRAELSGSAKERAENLMIVDLSRNDLGRVCETGSVRVPELFAVEAYATVFQLVSTVTGRLAAGRDGVDLVRAAFPPGSMSGAPKLAALRVLDALESDARGDYGGALGYFDVRGGLDLSVVIRTLAIRDGRAVLHVGGGIVADSDPAAEYAETLQKADALLRALRPADTPESPVRVGDDAEGVRPCA